MIVDELIYNLFIKKKKNFDETINLKNKITGQNSTHCLELFVVEFFAVRI